MPAIEPTPAANPCSGELPPWANDRHLSMDFSGPAKWTWRPPDGAARSDGPPGVQPRAAPDPPHPDPWRRALHAHPRARRRPRLSAPTMRITARTGGILWCRYQRHRVKPGRSPSPLRLTGVDLQADIATRNTVRRGHDREQFRAKWAHSATRKLHQTKRPSNFEPNGFIRRFGNCVNPAGIRAISSKVGSLCDSEIASNQ